MARPQGWLRQLGGTTRHGGHWDQAARGPSVTGSLRSWIESWPRSCDSETPIRQQSGLPNTVPARPIAEKEGFSLRSFACKERLTQRRTAHMWNWTRWSGVYSNMHRAPLFLVCSLAALAQQSTQQDPLDTAIQAVWQARSNGRFEDAAAAREQARAQLQRAPADSPRFTDWVYQVMQLYQPSNLNVQARVVLQESLTRTGPL